MIANRLAVITLQLVKADQVGFVKGRQAPDGTRWLYNLIHIAETCKTPTVVLMLDAEKAFNRVHWGYLSATLKKFGLNGFSYTSITSLYTKPSAKVFTSNVLLDTFCITNGTCQVCPLSPLIFSLIMESLVEAIRSCDSISGIEVGGYSHKL